MPPTDPGERYRSARVHGFVASRLIGRAPDRSVLDRVVNAAASGRGGTVIVRGEAGVGKSMLVGRLSSDAVAHGSVVLTGRCVRDASAPLRALSQVVMAALDAGADVDHPSLRLWRRALGALAPGAVEDAASDKLLGANHDALMLRRR